jgi:hypothetical protein
LAVRDPLGDGWLDIVEERGLDLLDSLKHLAYLS